VADLSDITTYLVGVAAGAIYPNGSSQPSITGKDVRIYEGWPEPAQLDLDMAGQHLVGNPPMPVTRSGGPVTNISVFPMQGGVPEPYQILDATYVIIAANYGMSFTVVGTLITVTGQPNPGEYLTIIADRAHVFSASGNTTASILAQLLTSAQGPYPSASGTSSTLTIPANISLVVRQGGMGTLGKVTHRQEQYVMVSVWAPTPQDRKAVAAAIDNVIKQKITVTMPDTTMAKIVYNRTNTIDEQQLNTIYRRDLIYNAEYATLWEFPGFVITSAEIDIINTAGDPLAPVLSPSIPALT
jgi:hypothetical protein